MDRKKFYDSLRGKLNLTTQNVFGMEKHLDYALAHGVPATKLPYHLATSWWETGQTMTPVVEANWLSEDWRRKNLRYYPFHGRGLVQTTWEANYRKVAELLGLPSETFVKKPELLLTWEYALPALFLAMDTGLYTGKKTSDYVDDLDESDEEDLREFVAARRVVNGTDKAKTIGNLALVFEKALKAAKYNPGEQRPIEAPLPPPVSRPEPEPADPVVSQARPWGLLLMAAIVVGILLAVAILS